MVPGASGLAAIEARQIAFAERLTRFAEAHREVALGLGLAQFVEQAAVARGVFGVPTFFVGDEMFFGKDRLGQVEEALAQA